MTFYVSNRAYFEHFERKRIEPSELEHRFFRASIEPSKIRAEFFSSISSTSALRAGKFSSEPSRAVTWLVELYIVFRATSSRDFSSEPSQNRAELWLVPTSTAYYLHSALQIYICKKMTKASVVQTGINMNIIKFLAQRSGCGGFPTPGSTINSNRNIFYFRHESHDMHCLSSRKRQGKF